MTTRDVLKLCFSDVKFSSNQVRECVCFWLTQCALCQFLSEPTGDDQLLVSAVCLVQETVDTSGTCCRCSFLSSMTQVNLVCSSRPTLSANYS